MTRSFFTVLAALSALLCVATVAMWITVWRTGGVLWISCATSTTGAEFEFVVYPKDLLLGFYRPGRRGVYNKTGLHGAWYSGPSGVSVVLPEHAFLGFAGGTTPDSIAGGGVLYRLDLPYWFIAALTGVLPEIRLCKRRRPFGPGYCARCGYDLRATPDRCPECGTVPAKKEMTTS